MQIYKIWPDFIDLLGNRIVIECVGVAMRYTLASLVKLGVPTPFEHYRRFANFPLPSAEKR